VSASENQFRNNAHIFAVRDLLSTLQGVGKMIAICGDQSSVTNCDLKCVTQERRLECANLHRAQKHSNSSKNADCAASQQQAPDAGV
jgi:hypothetical protein